MFSQQQHARCVNLLFVQSKCSPEFKEFLSNPTTEGLQKNPEFMFSALSVLVAIRHPKALLIQGAMATAAAGAAASASGAVNQAGATAMNSAVAEASGGAVNPKISPETAKAVMDNMDPGTMMEVMKIMKALKGM